MKNLNENPNENNDIHFPGLRQALDEIYKNITEGGPNFSLYTFLQNAPASQVLARANFAVAFKTYQWSGGNYEYWQKQSPEWKEAFKKDYPKIDLSLPQDTSLLSEVAPEETSGPTEAVNEDNHQQNLEEKSSSLDDMISTTSEELHALDSDDSDLMGEDIFSLA